MTKRSFGGSPDPEDVRRLIEIGCRTTPAAAAGCMVGNLTYNVVDRLGGLDVPTLVVVGSKDRTAPERSARRLAAALPKAEFVVLPGVGHPVGLQCPDRLTALINEFAQSPN